MSEIEIGKTYAFAGWPESQQGRKLLILEDMGKDLYRGRWPNGMTSMVGRRHLGGPVEPARPGVDEDCLLCGGTEEVSVSEPNPEKPWIRHIVGKEPCPNCAAGNGSEP